MTVAELIKEMRVTLGITQTRLGELIGFRKQVLSQYETGKKTPHLINMLRLIKASNTLCGTNLTYKDIHVNEEE